MVMRAYGEGRSVLVAFVAALALWPVLLGCGGGGSSEEQSSSETTQQEESQSAQSTVEETTSGEERFSAANFQELDSTIAGVMQDNDLPGVLVGVSAPGQGEYVSAQGSANLDTGAEPQTNDQFRIGSVTKTFVATAILQLVDQGKLSKSDTLSKWYPDFPNADEITVDDLLRMRSGIADYWDEETVKQYYDNPLENVTNEDIIEAAAAKADQFEPPDQETKYTDTNYNILGVILEKVSGNDIAAQLNETILAPLGLRNTFYPTDNQLPGNLRGYGLNPQSGEFEDKTILNPAPADGAGAMISDISDLGVWARALYNGDLLNPETQRARLETQPLEGASSGGAGYGEGIGGNGGIWGHGGTISGFSTEMWYIPEQDATIVISVNRSDEEMDSHSGEVLKAVITSLFPESLPSG
jgi:D-alanyl-D-alanine carboxypeptidase